MMHLLAWVQAVIERERRGDYLGKTVQVGGGGQPHQATSLARHASGHIRSDMPDSSPPARIWHRRLCPTSRTPFRTGSLVWPTPLLTARMVSLMCA
jgi:hypothetical protein